MLETKQLTLISGSGTTPTQSLLAALSKSLGFSHSVGINNPLPIHMSTFPHLEVARWGWVHGEGGGCRCP